ncbi:hypothetical protein KIPB_011967, partial [Kipferlia bialata]
SESVTFNLNGQDVQAVGKDSILDVCRRIGVYVPAVCYAPRLGPLGRCMACVVQDIDSGSYLMACSARPKPGQRICTDNPATKRKQSVAIDNVLSRQAKANVTGPSSVSHGTTEFETALHFRLNDQVTDNGAIRINAADCVQCGRCAAACSKLQAMDILELPNKQSVQPIGGIHLKASTSR